MEKQSLNDYVILHIVHTICRAMNSNMRKDKIDKIFQDKHEVLNKLSKNMALRMDTMRADLRTATSTMNQDFDKKTLSELKSLKTDLGKHVLEQTDTSEDIKSYIKYLNRLRSKHLTNKKFEIEIPIKTFIDSFTFRNELQNVEMATREIQLKISEYEKHL